MIELPKRIGNISDTDYLQEQINSMKHQLDNSIGGSTTTIANLSVENLEVKGKIDMSKNTSISWMNIKDAEDVATQESIEETKKAIAEAEKKIPTKYIPYTTYIDGRMVITESIAANNLKVTGGQIAMKGGETGAVLLANSSDTEWTQLDYKGIVSKDTYGTGSLSGGYLACDDVVADDIRATTSITIGGKSVLTSSDLSGYVKSGSEATFSKVFITNPGNYSSEAPNIFRSSTGQLCIAGGSSKRWKHDITTDINSELNPQRLYDVEVVQFKFNDDVIDPDDERYGKDMVGFIAEQVSDVAYNYASHDKEGNCIDWNSRQMIPAMLKLIQEQNKRIEELERRLQVQPVE